MPDRENVIYDIERCICHVPDACRDCSHYGHGEVIGCMEELLTDALELLKEQEYLGTELTNAVELIHKKNERIEKLLKEQEAVVHPEPSCEMTYITNCCCDLCGVQLIREDNYCRCCGKRIEWEGR